MMAVPPVEPVVPGSDLASEEQDGDAVAESAVSGSGGGGRCAAGPRAPMVAACPADDG